jgi:glycosyltransferase involved in cell wall biosynthesis
VLPKARSEHFERSREMPGKSTVYVARYSDLDSSSIWPSAHQVRLSTAWLWALRRRWDVVELPEPLWLRALPLTLSVGLAVRMSDLLFRRRTTITTYALENNDPTALLHGVPGGSEGALFGLIRFLVNRLYDRVALGSPAAGDCYAALRLLIGHSEVARFEGLIAAWEGEAEEPKSRRVTFVGVLERRKGLPDLLAAWTVSGLGRRGWQLMVAGSGPLAGALAQTVESDRSIIPLGMIDRREMRTLMASTSVVVLPSRREGRWREQIGLPIVEGLAHGCRVVATGDSGLSPWLRRNGHRVLPPEFTVDELAAALCAAAEDRLAPHDIQKSLPLIDGRTEAENWMYRAISPEGHG